MHQGRTLQELAAEVKRRREARVDYRAPTRQLALVDDGKLSIGDTAAVGLKPLAHRQIGQWAGIHANYYDRMLADAPQLLATNVNHWFQHSGDKRLVRTLDGDSDAYLSDGYQRVDNYPVLEGAIEALQRQGDYQVASCDITETRLYLKVLFPRLRGDVRVGDAVVHGLVISNSEVGLGAIDVAEYLERLRCLNGMVIPDTRVRRRHVGRRADDTAIAYRDDTLAADDKTVLLKLRDTIAQLGSEVAFRRTLEQLRETAGSPIQGRPVQVVEVLAKRHSLTEREGENVLEQLIRGDDMNRWGLANAITAASKDAGNYDRATEMEALGGKIMALPRTEWRELAEAA